MLQNYGGIGTAVTTLYSQKTANDQFLLISGLSERPAWLPPDVHFMKFQEFDKLQSLPLQADVTFVHNVFLMRPNLPGKKIYVSHSNMEMEKLLNPRVEDRFIQAFRNALSVADEIFCVSNSEKELLIQTNRKLVENKPIHVAYNGCEPQLPESDVPVTNLAQAGKPPVYGYIGRLDLRKGLFNLIEDFPSDRQLWIAGGGLDKYANETLRMMALRLANPERKNVIALGYCHGKRKENFFRSVDAVIVPSLYEPFGLTALESMRYQKPVIVAKTGGLQEILGPDHPLYFDPKDPQALAVAIRRLESLSTSARQQLIQFQNQRLSLFPTSAMVNTYRQA